MHVNLQRHLAGYYLTRDADSPGTPERPLSELGAIGYESFWIKNVLRSLLFLALDAVPTEERSGLQNWVEAAKETLKTKLASGAFLTYAGECPALSIKPYLLEC